MLIPGSVFENDKHKIIWDFEQETDLIPARRQDILMINKIKK